MRFKGLMVLAVALLVGADEAGDAGKKELKKFQGTWEMDKLEYNGKDESDKYKFKLVVKGDQGTVVGNDRVRKEYARVTLKLDPGTTPRSVDMSVTAGSQKDNVIEGIYRLKGDELTICAKVVGKERPTRFESPEGDSIALVVFKREKP